MKLLFQLILACCLLLVFSSSCYDVQGYWIPLECRRAAKFQERLEYHGLQYDVWVIRSDERGRYWIDNQGRRCRFD